MALIVITGCHQHFFKQFAAQPVNKVACDVIHEIGTDEKTYRPGEGQHQNSHWHSYPGQLDPGQSGIAKKMVGEARNNTAGHLAGFSQGVQQKLHHIRE